MLSVYFQFLRTITQKLYHIPSTSFSLSRHGIPECFLWMKTRKRSYFLKTDKKSHRGRPSRAQPSTLQRTQTPSSPQLSRPVLHRPLMDKPRAVRPVAAEVSVPTCSHFTWERKVLCPFCLSISLMFFITF